MVQSKFLWKDQLFSRLAYQFNIFYANLSVKYLSLIITPTYNQKRMKVSNIRNTPTVFY